MCWQENAHLKFARIVQIESGLLVYSPGKNDHKSNHHESVILSSISKECRATDGGMGSTLYLGIARTSRKSCLCAYVPRETQKFLFQRGSSLVFLCIRAPIQTQLLRVGIFPLAAVGITPLTSHARIRPLEIFLRRWDSEVVHGVDISPLIHVWGGEEVKVLRYFDSFKLFLLYAK